MGTSERRTTTLKKKHTFFILELSFRILDAIKYTLSENVNINRDFRLALGV